MPCDGLDIHSPYLFICAAGLFFGAALSAAVRSFLRKGKRHNLTVAGLYLYLSLFFVVILSSIFFIDIPSLRFSSSFLIAGVTAMGLGGLAATWKRAVGAVLVVLVLTLLTLLSLHLRDHSCGIENGGLIDFRVLGVREGEIELEVLEAIGYKEGRVVVPQDTDSNGIAVVYTRTDFAPWIFYPKAETFYRVENIRPLSDNGGERNVSLLERVVDWFPGISVSVETLGLVEPAEFSRYRGVDSENAVELKKVRGALEL